MKIVLLQPYRLILKGEVTGTVYEWSNAGSVIEVDDRDAIELLKRKSRSCQTCSGTIVETPYFEIVR